MYQNVPCALSTSEMHGLYESVAWEYTGRHRFQPEAILKEAVSVANTTGYSRWILNCLHSLGHPEAVIIITSPPVSRIMNNNKAHDLSLSHEMFQ